MSLTGLAVFDTTIQETNGWLREIMEALRWDDRRRAYHALRGTLHAVRDYLTTDEGAQLSAQLPMLMRGLYYEGWDPAREPPTGRSRDDFLRRVAAEFDHDPDLAVDPERVADAALRVLSCHISAGEVAQARAMLPKDVRALWPA